MFGIIIFFAVITLILWFLRVYGLKYYEKIENNTAIIKQENKDNATTLHLTKNDNEDELIPVIIAAASAILCSKVKVKKISFVDPTKGNEWTHTGRIQNLSSHYMTVPKTYKY